MSRLVDASAARAASVAQHYCANRFMPLPAPELMLCGDGDFRAIGAEFLVHFAELGGLAPGERVLDLGCGVGRMALPLTQYLGDHGAYDGVDVVAPCIDWCARAITPVYPNFRFMRLDVANPLYNPAGALDPASVRLPYADGTFDFVALVSMLTHVDPATLDRYAQEVARVLAPGGRCFATAFLLNVPSRAGIAAGTARPAFPHQPGAGVLYADPASPLAAVAYDEDRFLAAFLAAGLRRIRPARYGNWSGRDSDVFQDIAILERG
jgi:SAM-dependent methyltransferase